MVRGNPTNKNSAANKVPHSSTDFESNLANYIDHNDNAQVALAQLAIASYCGKYKEVVVAGKGEAEIVGYTETDLGKALAAVKELLKLKSQVQATATGNQSISINFVTSGDPDILDPYDTLRNVNDQETQYEDVK